MSTIQPRVFYGWYMVASTFVILCLGFGAAYSFAAFFPPLRHVSRHAVFRQIREHSSAE